MNHLPVLEVSKLDRLGREVVAVVRFANSFVK
jgi:hypothetical protein